MSFESIGLQGPNEEIPKGGWRGPNDEIPKGGWRSRSTTDTYRTKDGRGFFDFEFVDVGSRIEIDILSSPSYESRPSGLHETHRLPSGRGGYKICFGDESIVKTLSGARKWAAIWAEMTWRYIRTGIPIPNN